jgi:hypothetical protein
MPNLDKAVRRRAATPHRIIKGIFPLVAVVAMVVVSAAIVPSGISAASVTPASLYEALLRTPFGLLPGGFANPIVSSMPLTASDRNNGIIGGAQVTFRGPDPQAKLAFVVLSDYAAASNFNHQYLANVLPNQKLLAYPPMARCADVPGRGGRCDMWLQTDNAIIVATAARVDGDAAILMRIGYDHLRAAANSAAAVPAQPPVSAGTPDACALVTASEAALALNGARVGGPQRDQVGGCSWPSLSVPGDGLTVQVIGTGRAGFDAAKKRTSGAVALPGVGDDAFVFVSQAGFVQVGIVKHGRYVSFSLQSQRDAMRLDKAKTLAASIAARL